VVLFTRYVNDIGPTTMKNKIQVEIAGKTYSIGWSVHSLNAANKPVFYAAMTKQEQKIAEQFETGLLRLRYAAGRYCAKQAIGFYNPALQNQTINIGSGIWGYPYVDDDVKGQMNISIAHSDEAAIAVCTHGALPVGVDMEDYKKVKDAIFLSLFTDKEKMLLTIPKKQSEMLHVMWVAKEAAAKALRTGFLLPESFFEVSGIIEKEGVWHVNFEQVDILTAVAIPIAKNGMMPKKYLALALPTGSKVISGLEDIKPEK